METEIKAGKEYYYPKLNIKVTVKYADGDYAYVRDADRNSYSVHISQLRELMEMSIDDILKREG